MQKEAIFYKKNFLIYGFGKSGFASYKFLSKKNNCKIIDDNKKNIPIKYWTKKLSKGIWFASKTKKKMNRIKKDPNKSEQIFFRSKL